MLTQIAIWSAYASIGLIFFLFINIDVSFFTVLNLFILFIFLYMASWICGNSIGSVHFVLFFDSSGTLIENQRGLWLRWFCVDLSLKCMKIIHLQSLLWFITCIDILIQLNYRSFLTFRFAKVFVRRGHVFRRVHLNSFFFFDILSAFGLSQFHFSVNCLEL